MRQVCLWHNSSFLSHILVFLSCLSFLFLFFCFPSATTHPYILRLVPASSVSSSSLPLFLSSLLSPPTLLHPPSSISPDFPIPFSFRFHFPFHFPFLTHPIHPWLNCFGKNKSITDHSSFHPSTPICQVSPPFFRNRPIRIYIHFTLLARFSLSFLYLVSSFFRPSFAPTFCAPSVRACITHRSIKQTSLPSLSTGSFFFVHFRTLSSSLSLTSLLSSSPPPNHNSLHSSKSISLPLPSPFQQQQHNNNTANTADITSLNTDHKYVLNPYSISLPPLSQCHSVLPFIPGTLLHLCHLHSHTAPPPLPPQPLPLLPLPT